jgi:signal recognition particle subunit SRP54
MLPGMGNALKDVDVDDKQLAHVEAIIYSMTPDERRDPKLLTKGGARRRRRIAAGSGRTVQEVNRLLKQFDQARKVMKSVSKMAGMESMNPQGRKGKRAQAKAAQQMLRSGQLPGGAPPGAGGLGGFKGLQSAPKKK